MSQNMTECVGYQCKCFFKYKFIYFNWRLITLQYCIGFATHQHESATGVHLFPILSPASHLPPRTIPLGHPSAPALRILFHASNLDWRFFSHMILYMFQCHSPNHPTLALSHRVQKLFYTSVSVLLSCIQCYCYHLSKFHIYVIILYWYFSFWLTSLCIIGSSFIHLIRTDSKTLFFETVLGLKQS